MAEFRKFLKKILTAKLLWFKNNQEYFGNNNINKQYI